MKNLGLHGDSNPRSCICWANILPITPRSVHLSKKGITFILITFNLTIHPYTNQLSVSKSLQMEDSIWLDHKVMQLFMTWLYRSASLYIINYFLKTSHLNSLNQNSRSKWQKSKKIFDWNQKKYLKWNV